MADKSVGELIAAQSVTPTDLFVLEQNGTAKKLTGQILENWLVSFADGHGGIQSIVKKGTSGLVDTYRITLADTTTFDFVVTNGRGITGISKTSTSGLVDTYTISYNNGTTSKFTVTNGAKGDKGDDAYAWIKYASQEPTESSHSIGDIPDDWIGIYSGNASTAPTDWKQYKWYRIKGEQGDTGDPATIVSASITYQAGDSGTVIPSGSWSTSVPPVTPGKFLWTRQVLQFNTGAPITSYSISRFGIDGTGSVSTVAGISPDAAGNVPLTASDVKALPVAGGTMEGGINMNGQSLSGLNAPTKDDEAATKGYVDELKNDTETYVNNAVRTAAPRNLLDNSDFRNPVNQRGAQYYEGETYCIDRWKLENANSAIGIVDGGIHLKCISGYAGLIQNLERGDKLYGKTLTFAINADANVYTTTFKFRQAAGGRPLGDSGLTLYSVDGDDILLRSYGDNEVIGIRWAALYEGEYTADNLPAYQPKGYGVELDECKRYFIRTNLYAAGVTNSPSSALIGLQNTYNMRIAPTIVINPFVGTITFSKSPAKSAEEITGSYRMASKTILNIQFNANVAEIWEPVYVIFGAVDYSADL